MRPGGTRLLSSVGSERVQIASGSAPRQLDLESRAWIEGLSATGAEHAAATRAPARPPAPSDLRRGSAPPASLPGDRRCRARRHLPAGRRRRGRRGHREARRIPRRQPLHDLGLRVRDLRGLGQAPPARMAWTQRSRPPTTTASGIGWPSEGTHRAGARRVRRASARPASCGRGGADAPATRGVRRGRAQRRARSTSFAGQLALDTRRGLQGAPRRTAEAPPAPRARRTPEAGGEMNDRDPLHTAARHSGRRRRLRGRHGAARRSTSRRSSPAGTCATSSRPWPSTCATVRPAQRTTKASSRSPASTP